jgi:hypothetical protein
MKFKPNITFIRIFMQMVNSGSVLWCPIHWDKVLICSLVGYILNFLPSFTVLIYYR